MGHIQESSPTLEYSQFDFQSSYVEPRSVDCTDAVKGTSFQHSVDADQGELGILPLAGGRLGRGNDRRVICEDAMADVTRLLAQIESGNRQSAEKLLPLVYEELRKLAAARLGNEKPGQTLQATALVHEAYVRLVGGDANEPSWSGRSHFFAAAAEAMRRILVEAARRKSRDKHGVHWRRAAVDADQLVAAEISDPFLILAVNESLDRLSTRAPRKAELVKLRYFVGCTLTEAAEILGIAEKTAEADWTYARAWLRREWLRQEKSASDL